MGMQWKDEQVSLVLFYRNTVKRKGRKVKTVMDKEKER